MFTNPIIFTRLLNMNKNKKWLLVNEQHDMRGNKFYFLNNNVLKIIVLFITIQL